MATLQHVSSPWDKQTFPQVTTPTYGLKLGSSQTWPFPFLSSTLLQMRSHWSESSPVERQRSCSSDCSGFISCCLCCREKQVLPGELTLWLRQCYQPCWSSSMPWRGDSMEMTLLNLWTLILECGIPCGKFLGGSNVWFARSKKKKKEIWKMARVKTIKVSHEQWRVWFLGNYWRINSWGI